MNALDVYQLVIELACIEILLAVSNQTFQVITEVRLVFDPEEQGKKMAISESLNK
jgi:hypothetical protein